MYYNSAIQSNARRVRKSNANQTNISSKQRSCKAKYSNAKQRQCNAEQVKAKQSAKQAAKQTMHSNPTVLNQSRDQLVFKITDFGVFLRV